MFSRDGAAHLHGRCRPTRGATYKAPLCEATACRGHDPPPQPFTPATPQPRRSGEADGGKLAGGHRTTGGLRLRLAGGRAAVSAWRAGGAAGAAPRRSACGGGKLAVADAASWAACGLAGGRAAPGEQAGQRASMWWAHQGRRRDGGRLGMAGARAGRRAEQEHERRSARGWSDRRKASGGGRP